MIGSNQERNTWRSGVRSAIHAASQQPGGGTLIWMMHLHVNQEFDDNYDHHPHE